MTNKTALRNFVTSYTPCRTYLSKIRKLSSTQTTSAMETYPPLKRIKREDLRDMMLSDTYSTKEIAIVDVRDSDHVGGHIKSSLHRPSSSLSHSTPDLVQELKNYKSVVFHCALSQQRGPGAALKYINERRRLFGKDAVSRGDEGTNDAEEGSAQKVLVLEGGFVEWQEVFGKDERLTDKYDEEIWSLGYLG